jgi:hypothetical protein
MFVQNPRGDIHDCAFNINGGNVYYDIIMGGIAPGNGFQGYKSSIERNYFSGCATAIKLGIFANGIRIANNECV